MTKKHFEAAALYVRRYQNRVLAEVLADAFVDVFSQFNPRFDADRFRAACRGEDATDSAGRTVRYRDKGFHEAACEVLRAAQEHDRRTRVRS